MTATKGGLVIAGLVVPVEGMRIDNYVDNPKLHLHAKGYRNRSTSWVRQACLHTTKGLWPQPIGEGTGRTDLDQHVIDYYKAADDYNGCNLIFDGDSGICAADLKLHATNNATTANDNCFGIEMYQEADGTVRRATIDNAVAAIGVAFDELEIPRQYVADQYVGTIIPRLKGGRDPKDQAEADRVVGLFGHRDQAWKFPWQLTPAQLKTYPNGYAARGRGDPGDYAYTALAAAGWEGFRYNAREDLTQWARRQAALTRMGETGLRRLDGSFDGVAGPATMRAMKRRGFASGRDLDIAAGIVR